MVRAQQPGLSVHSVPNAASGLRCLSVWAGLRSTSGSGRLARRAPEEHQAHAAAPRTREFDGETKMNAVHAAIAESAPEPVALRAPAASWDRSCRAQHTVAHALKAVPACTVAPLTRCGFEQTYIQTSQIATG